MDKLRTQDVGGFPLLLNDLRQFFGRLASPSHGIYQAFNNLLKGFSNDALGNDFIIQGCIASGTTPNVAITEGWVLLGGELIKVDAQTGIDTATDNKFVKVTTFDPRGTKTFQNSTINETYEKNRAVIQGTVGNLPFDGNRMENLALLQRKGTDSDPEDTGIITLLDDGRRFAIIDTSGKDADIEFITERPGGTTLILVIDGTTPRTILSTSGGGLPNDANGKLTNRIRIDGASSYKTTALEILIFQSTGLGTGGTFFGGWNLIGTNRIGSIAQGIITTGIKTDNVLLKFKKLNLGVWNMDADRFSLSVVHDLSDILKIVSIEIIITKDGSIIRHPLFGTFNVLGTDKLGGSYELSSTTITAVRTDNGFFDDSSFNNVTDPINRGDILITYEP